MAQTDSLLTFNVRRREPELIAPASPTPRELKRLSDIDDQDGLRIHISAILFYPPSANMQNKDPVSVIREALAKVLVFYYPLAGRLREGPARKLMVDCTGEGVLFIEADADVTLKQFGYPLHPPFPCIEELLYDVPGSGEMLNSPLLLIQVTRLLCGGFIMAIRSNHTMADGSGFIQFLTALGEMAKGASKPSILPVWQRELLFARDPPRVTCTHNEYDEVEDTKGKIIPLDDDMSHRSLFMTRAEVSALRRFVPPHLQKCSTFDVLTACLWRCRTISLQPDPEEEMRLICAVSAHMFNPPLLPVGYYGNSFAIPLAISTARDLSTKPLSHALELVMKVKSDVTEEYIRSVADLLVTKGRPHYTDVNTYAVSDLTRLGTNAVDCGWGKPVYGGPIEADVATYFIPFTNEKGESCIVLPICLPSAAMDKFFTEINKMLNRDNKLQKEFSRL
ncbi:benzyl alcohol O-benzoyltransferase [Tanacetum coccineum]